MKRELKAKLCGVEIHKMERATRRACRLKKDWRKHEFTDKRDEIWCQRTHKKPRHSTSDFLHCLLARFAVTPPMSLSLGAACRKEGISTTEVSQGPPPWTYHSKWDKHGTSPWDWMDGTRGHGGSLWCRCDIMLYHIYKVLVLDSGSWGLTKTNSCPLLRSRIQEMTTLNSLAPGEIFGTD